MWMIVLGALFLVILAALFVDDADIMDVSEDEYAEALILHDDDDLEDDLI